MTETLSPKMLKERKNINLIYILYLCGLLIFPISIGAVIAAYVKRENADDFLLTHLNYQIRTFWGSLFLSIMLVTGIFLSIFGYAAYDNIISPHGETYGDIAILTILWIIFITFALFQILWYSVRCIKGIVKLSEGHEIRNPHTWLW